MKKIYILLAAGMMAAAANAQTVNFTQNGNVIPNGSELEFNDAEIDPFGGITINPQIYIVSDENTEIDVRAICTTGQKIQLCAGGDCVAGTGVKKPNVSLTAGVPLDTKFEYVYTPGEEKPKVVISELYVDLSSDPGEPITAITIVMDVESASVSVLEADDNFSYVDGELRYNVPTPCDAMIYDATGKCVYKANVCGLGVISTSDLSSGTYIYKFGKKGGKILVK